MNVQVVYDSDEGDDDDNVVTDDDSDDGSGKNHHIVEDSLVSADESIEPTRPKHLDESEESMLVMRKKVSGFFMIKELTFL